MDLLHAAAGEPSGCLEAKPALSANHPVGPASRRRVSPPSPARARSPPTCARRRELCRDVGGRAQRGSRKGAEPPGSWWPGCGALVAARPPRAAARPAGEARVTRGEGRGRPRPRPAVSPATSGCPPLQPRDPGDRCLSPDTSLGLEHPDRPHGECRLWEKDCCFRGWMASRNLTPTHVASRICFCSALWGSFLLDFPRGEKMELIGRWCTVVFLNLSHAWTPFKGTSLPFSGI